MTTLQQTRTDLEQLLDRFLDAWARHDLEAAMACMAEDSRYDEFNGVVWQGKDRVREGFLPQFRGDYGDIQFLEEDRFIDAEAGRMLVRWICRFDWRGAERRWRGLDILHVRDGLITEKLTYAKADRPHTQVEG
jgi:hypothetical protein